MSASLYYELCKRRGVWLRALKTGDTVKIRQGEKEIQTSVYQATDKFLWCQVSDTDRVRFCRSTGKQWGGPMRLEIPDNISTSAAKYVAWLIGVGRKCDDQKSYRSEDREQYYTLRGWI